MWDCLLHSILYFTAIFMPVYVLIMYFYDRTVRNIHFFSCSRSWKGSCGKWCFPETPLAMWCHATWTASTLPVGSLTSFMFTGCSAYLFCFLDGGCLVAGNDSTVAMEISSACTVYVCLDVVCWYSRLV